MTIHGPLERDPEPDPLYDAVGRAVESATHVESWLNLLAGQVAGFPYDAQPWSKISDKVRAAVEERLLPADRALVAKVITEAERLLNIRNGIVHGIWMWGETRAGVAGFSTQRPPRSKNPPMTVAPDGELVAAWTTETFTRERLLNFANECQAVAAIIQQKSGGWTEHLLQDDEI